MTLRCQTFPSQVTPPKAAVVLCHGYGAPGSDLVGLYEPLVGLAPELKHAAFYFPEAPLSLSHLFGGDARAWWNLDMQAVAAAQRGDVEALRELRHKEPEGMAHARASLKALLDSICRDTGLPLSRIALGGFSQGAMLATDVALRLEEAPLGLVALSGTLLMEESWRARAQKRQSLPVFQSHGTQDATLRFDAAQALRDVLATAGLTVEFHAFDDGHTIPMTVLRSMAAFLGKLVNSLNKKADVTP